MNFPTFEQFEKENSYNAEEYHIKTKQYSNILKTPARKPYREGSHSHYQDRTNDAGASQLSTLSPHREAAKRYQPNTELASLERSEKVGVLNMYNKDADKSCEIPRYTQTPKREAYCMTPNYQVKSKPSKGSPETDSLEMSAYNKLRDVSVNNPKREGYLKGFDMKMNNISMMNDKISTLLDMVKIDRHKLASGSKSQHKNSPSLKEKKTNGERQRQRYMKPQVKRTSPEQKYHQHRDYLGKRTQKEYRLHTYTGYEKEETQVEEVQRAAKPKYSKFNEEESTLKYQKYIKPNIEVPIDRKPYKRGENQIIKNNIKDRMNHYRKDNSPQTVNNRPKQQSYHQPSKSSSKLASYLYELEPKESRKEQASRSFVDQAGSLNGVEGKDMYEYVPKFKGTMVREEKVDGGGGGGLLPVSLQNQRSNKPKPMGCNLIDEKLQRIKSKILQSESQTNKIQRRLDSTSKVCEPEDRQQAKAGTLYRKGAYSPPPTPESFEIKVLPIPIDKEQVVNIASKLYEQSLLDQQLKVARIVFEKRPDPSKWDQLEYQLKARGIQFTKDELKELITIAPEEFSPFDSQVAQTDSELSVLFIEAQQHWDREVFGCASLRALKREDFAITEMDLAKKGYISLEDIVCFMGLYTGKSLRNRDITLLFRRMQLLQPYQTTQGIEYQTFMKTVAS